MKLVNNKIIKKISKKVLLSAGIVGVATVCGDAVTDIVRANNNCSESINYDSENKELNLGRTIDDKYTKAFIEKVYDNYKNDINFENVVIEKNSYIKSLNCLNGVSDEIRKLSIINCSSLTDLSLVYKLPNLEEIKVVDSPWITEDFVNYLDNNNIKHNITVDDINNNKRIDNIVSSIITNDMNDYDKIKAITYYIDNNFTYDLEYTEISNSNPIDTMFKYNKGVCAGYAYLANAMFKKCGIDSYYISGNNHAWNLVNIDNKYYYVDTTWTQDSTDFDKWMIDNFNTGKYYMVDPRHTANTGMVEYNDSKDKINISSSLVSDIHDKENNKNILERYSYNYLSQFNNDFLTVLTANLCIDGIYMMYKVFKHIIKKCNNEYDYADTYYSINTDGEVLECNKVFELKLNNRKK